MRRSYWQGALWLAVGAIGSRLIGAVYRVALPRLLGDRGVGLFQMAYPLYAVALALSVSGVPLALSQRTAALYAAGEAALAERLADAAFAALGAMGILAGGVLFWAAPWLAVAVFHEPVATLSIRALSPALPLVAMQAALRGHFQGRQDMRPPAISQIVEQAVRVAVLFPLAVAGLSRGLGTAVAGATLGAPAGALAGCWYLVRRRRPIRAPVGRPALPWRELWQLARVAAPLAFSALTVPLLLVVDAVVVPSRLMAGGVTATGATAAYGRLSGEAMPLVNVVLVLGTALAVGLVPSVAESFAREAVAVARRRVEMALHALWLALLPLSGMLVALAEPLTAYLYGRTGAAAALMVLAAGTPGLGVQQLLGNALQAGGDGWIPVRNLAAGAAVKLLLTWWLVPAWGIRGAALATTGAAWLAGGLNWQAWRRRAGGEAGGLWQGAWPALVGTLLMATAMRGYLALVTTTPVTVGVAVGLGVLVYAVVVGLMGEARFVRRLWRDR